jgi:hypothetical protein
MRQHFILILLLLVCLIFGSIYISAQEDDQGNPNDPHVNDRANACYEDGSMESKCDTEWEWICGWYMIRFDAGIFSRSEVPAMCNSLLPIEIESTGTVEEEVISNCAGMIYGSFFVQFGSGNFLPSPVMGHIDIECTSNTSLIFLDLVYTTAGVADAAAICNANLPAPSWSAAVLSGNIYYCFR